MSSLLSIRLSDELLQKIKQNAHILHLSQTEYVRQAIEHMNTETEKAERTHGLKQASLRVRKESMKVNAEFRDIEYDPKA